jgi:hypothetical protein
VAVSDESMACAESPSSVTSPRLESKRSGRECKVILTELDTNRGGGDRLYPATQDGNLCNHNLLRAQPNRTRRFFRPRFVSESVGITPQLRQLMLYLAVVAKCLL